LTPRVALGAQIRLQPTAAKVGETFAILLNYVRMAQQPHIVFQVRDKMFFGIGN
jgi:hypothetical protein